MTFIAIPDSVTTIDDLAFWDAGITAVTLPKSVTKLGFKVFRECSELVSIKVDPENEVFCDIGGALYSKDKTTFIQYPPGSDKLHFSVPDGVTAIGDNAFSNCGLIDVSLPDGVRTIGAEAFSFCEHLMSVKIPAGLETIGYGAFTYCTHLNAIHLPNGLTTIDGEAFNGCRRLDSVTIPGSVVKIGDDAFLCCTKLGSIQVAPENEHYCSVDGSLYTKDKTVLIKCTKVGIEPECFVIPDGVKEIRNMAFEVCKVSAIVVPASVERIEEDGLSWCYNLNRITVNPENEHYCSENGVLYNKEKTVLIKCPEENMCGPFVIPCGITEIGYRAFTDCRMTAVVIPRSVKVIGREAFIQCYGLTAVAIPNSVEEIGERAFSWCGSLSAVSIPDSVRVIGEEVFRGCEDLSYVTFMTLSDREIKIGEKVFDVGDDYLTIIAPRDTYMIDYAKEHGIDYQEI